jgi:serine/threonine-protein kinase
MTPEKISRYKIEEELGRGGMATVYRAYDPHFERMVAVKVLPRAFLHEPEFRARFTREAKTIASLEHPAIVPVYDYGEDQDQPFLVMRYMRGGSLTDRLTKTPLSVEEAANILKRIGSALDQAHSRGIIHRDLKPANILFDDYGEAYLADFGIVHVSSSSAALTASGSLVGTPAYMSPEQVYGDKQLDGRSDIYALGVILFQMLTGSVPYSADTPARLMMKHVMDPVPPVLERRPDLPPDCDRVIMKAMAKDREARFPSATAMSSALTAATVRSKSPEVPVRGKVKSPEVGLDIETTELLELDEPSELKAPGLETELRQGGTTVHEQEPRLKAPVLAPRQPKVETEPNQKAGSKVPAWTVMTAGLLLVICFASVYGVYWLVKNDRIPFLAGAPTATIGAIDTPVTGLTGDATPLPGAAPAGETGTSTAPGASPTSQPEIVSAADATRESLIATRAALAEQSATPTVDARTIVTANSELTTLFGPEDGELLLGQDDPIVLSPAGLNVRDFTAAARFTNPSAASARAWDIGLVLRKDGAGQALQLIVRSDGTWLLNLRRSEADQVLDSGNLDRTLDASDQGTNRIMFIARAETGYFILNDTFVAALDLSLFMGSGDIAVATGFYGRETPQDVVVPFEEFNVWSLDLVFGPRSNQLDHVADGSINLRGAGVEFADFVADVAFVNPYAAAFGAWDVGYSFRNVGPTGQYWLILDSESSWSFIDRRSGEDTFLAEGDLNNLDVREGGTNRLTLIAVDTRGYFLVNGSFIASLDLSGRADAGDVQVATSFFIGDEIEGRTTRYEAFSIWSLP